MPSRNNLDLAAERLALTKHDDFRAMLEDLPILIGSIALTINRELHLPSPNIHVLNVLNFYLAHAMTVAENAAERGEVEPIGSNTNATMHELFNRAMAKVLSSASS